MKKLLLVLLITYGLSACSTQPAQPEIVLNDKLVLILALQGFDPAKDTFGFNNLTRNVTQSFSAHLAQRLSEFGKTTVNVIDQTTRFNSTQKIAIYSVKERAKTSVILSLEAENVFGDERLNLRAQWVEERPHIEDGELIGVTATSVIQQVYVLRGSKSGVRGKTMDELAADFVGAIKTQGKL